MDLSNNNEIKKLIKFAYSRNFSSSIKHETICFYPHEMDWNKYLTIHVKEENINLLIKITEHKFLQSHKYIGSVVSIKWLEGFFNFRSEEAKKDTHDYLQSKRLNEKMRRKNEEFIVDKWEEDNVRTNLKNEGLASGTLDSPSSEDGDTFNDDWDSGDWEEYMTGPDFEDGQPRW